MLPDNDFEKIYRPSATVIVAAIDPAKELDYDYRILLAMRTAATAYAPDHYVFPGGVFDSRSDENPEWLQHFYNFGITSKDLNKLCLEHLPNRPKPIMTNRKHFCRDISLRITAIREAFEEVGLLLCLSREELEKPHKGSGTFKSNFDRFHWQEKVHNNSLEFLNLCRHLNVVPDIWSLHEWSIWRSPTTSLKRYDTALYLVLLEEQPELVLEPTEVEQVLWISPALSLRLYKDRQIWLPPLQFYEISRLTHELCWAALKEFALRRSSLGCTLLMMAYYRCDDSLVGALPYDDHYPVEPLDHNETIRLQGTSFDFEARTKNIHRIIYRDMYDMTTVCNIPSLDHHLCPIPRHNEEQSISKL